MNLIREKLLRLHASREENSKGKRNHNCKAPELARGSINYKYRKLRIQKDFELQNQKQNLKTHRIVSAKSTFFFSLAAGGNSLSAADPFSARSVTKSNKLKKQKDNLPRQRCSLSSTAPRNRRILSC